jgi:hypothetical protein
MNKMDPSGTALLRKAAVETVNSHYRFVISTLRKYLKDYKPGKFMPEEIPVVIDNFHLYFLKLLNNNLIDNAKISKTIEDSYSKGVKKAVRTLKAKELINLSSPEFARGVESAYIRTLTQNSNIEQLIKFNSRSLNTINQTVVDRVSTSVYEGIRSDYNQLQMFHIMRSAIQKVAVNRARTTVRTEIVRAQACGLLDSFAQMGVDTVMIDVEKPPKLTTNSKGQSVNECPLCKPLENRVFTLQEAYGLIPVHPNCRCSVRPIGTDNVKLPVMLNDVISDND